MLATDIDAELGVITCVWDRTGQMTRRSIPERSYTGGFNLIPVSGVGEAVRCVSEAISERKKEETGSKEHSSMT